jgi:hypothetical protein
MLLHLSIPALDPRHVADVLAETLGGEAFPFHAFTGAWIVVIDDGRGSAVEVLPAATWLDIGATAVAEQRNQPVAERSTVHFAAETPLSAEKVAEIARRENWTARVCDRGPFRLIELWIENRFLVELLPPEMRDDYRSAMTTANWRQWS